MAKAKFNKFTEKLAGILVKSNAWQITSDYVYVPQEPVLAATKCKDKASLEKGTEFDIPDGFSLRPLMNYDTNEALTTESGEPLMELYYEA